MACITGSTACRGFAGHVPASHSGGSEQVASGDYASTESQEGEYGLAVEGLNRRQCRSCRRSNCTGYGSIPTRYHLSGCQPRCEQKRREGQRLKRSLLPKGNGRGNACCGQCRCRCNQKSRSNCSNVMPPNRVAMANTGTADTNSNSTRTRLPANFPTTNCASLMRLTRRSSSVRRSFSVLTATAARQGGCEHGDCELQGGENAHQRRPKTGSVTGRNNRLCGGDHQPAGGNDAKKRTAVDRPGYEKSLCTRCKSEFAFKNSTQKHRSRQFLPTSGKKRIRTLQ